ncbi:HAD-IIIA family hydrolase [Halobacteriovorax sp. ZH4_bin.1]|uniref:HAD-IIIA family hydrolase n=1 Tax=unclassified Halobacteriovorax TaxID=2639665 RepID=UPI00371EF8CF
MFDIVLCQRDLEEIKKCFGGTSNFEIHEFEGDSQLRGFLNDGKTVLLITTKSSVKPDLFNLYQMPKNGNCEYYYLSKLNLNGDELEACEKYFPEVRDISVCADYYSAGGVFYIDQIDPVGMPNFTKEVMPVLNRYFSVDDYKEALFLDRDGVLNIDHSYVHKTSELELVAGAYEFLLDDYNKKRLKVVLTNQSGVSKGMFEYTDVQKFNAALNESLHHLIDAFYIAPFEFTKGVGQYKYHSLLRKPHPGMLLEACFDFAIDLKKSYMVGDKISDQLNFPLLETIHLKNRYPLDGVKYLASNFEEVLKFAKSLPNKTN